MNILWTKSNEEQQQTRNGLNTNTSENGHKISKGKPHRRGVKGKTKEENTRVEKKEKRVVYGVHIT